MAQQQQVSIGGLIFDAVVKTNHASKLTATSRPIENGANITDHAFVDPKEITIEIGMTDCNGVGVSDKMFKSLQSLQESRRPLTVQTRFRRYTNMLIMSMSVPDDYTTMNALKATLLLKEIPVVGTQTVALTIGGQRQKTGSTNNGTIQAQSAIGRPVEKQAEVLLQGPDSIVVGSEVKIKAGAKYYNGQSIPAWVASDTWIVSSLKGDRAVLGKNVSGKNDIQSPIKVSDLVLA